MSIQHQHATRFSSLGLNTFILSILLLAALSPCSAAVPKEDLSNEPQAKQPAQTARIVIPLENGKLNAGTLVTNLYEAVGEAPPDELKSLNWSIDVQSIVGRAQLDMIERWSDGVLGLAADDRNAVITFDSQRARDLAAQNEQTIKQLVRDWSTWLAGARPDRYGITFVTDEDERRPLAEMKHVPEHVVVLVHGLDDPGWMWRDLIPVLRERDYAVARFEYPNDGAVTRAADLLAVSLITMRYSGVERVDLVAHSMGGLVCRDVLTRASYYNGDGTGTRRLPAVDRLIMVGTPNHGSHMARLRGLAELREHIQRLVDSDLPLRSPFFDGSGQAGADILPGSDYLKTLNARGRPKHTRFSIIAGRTSPLDESHLNELSQAVQQLAQSEDMPGWLRDMIKAVDPNKAAPALRAIVENVGDGLVTIESAKLDGVQDFVIVDGNHISVLINIIESSDRTPPAIPVILNRLVRPIDGDDVTSD